MQDALFGDDAVGEPTWTVRDLSRAVGRVLDQAFPAEVWVRGEIRDLPPPGDPRRARPHLYFDLIEPTSPGERPAATLSVVLWNTDRKRVNNELRRSGTRVSVMESGADVRIRGRIRWWAPGGRPQLQMTGIDPAHTLGRLAADREAVLAALHADGLLEANAALDLPLLPERVGLVTSLGTAAHADVRRVMETAGLAHLLVEADARTQGPGALDTLPAAIAQVVAAGAEVVLLVRGGGSRVELACFDSEVVARAVATCPVPVLTGIGHEIDDSVADRVAHTACATPTAAAVEVVALVAAARDRTEALWSMIASGALRSIERHRHRLDSDARHAARGTGASVRAAEVVLAAAADRVRRSAPAGLDRAGRALTAASAATARATRRDLDAAGAALDGARLRLGRAAAPTVERRTRDLRLVEARVEAVDPARVLARGWSITVRADGTAVRSVAQVAPGEHLTTVVADGRIPVEVRADGPGSGDG